MADINYVRLDEQLIYLAVVLDAFSRKVVGWAIAHHLQAIMITIPKGRYLPAFETRSEEPVILHVVPPEQGKSRRLLRILVGVVSGGGGGSHFGGPRGPRRHSEYWEPGTSRAEVVREALRGGRRPRVLQAKPKKSTFLERAQTERNNDDHADGADVMDGGSRGARE
jgi:hypothetical protein